MNLHELKWAIMSSNESKWAQTSLNEPKLAKMGLNKPKRTQVTISVFKNDSIWAQNGLKYAQMSKPINELKST